MYFALSWHDDNYDLLEWDIIGEDRLETDERLTDAVMDVAYDADRELYIDIDDAALRGPDTVDGAVWINIAGPFDNQLAAQYYIDAEVAEDDGYY